ncbi:MAG: site-2 protease family protein [Vicinamibacterales bacterium]
MASLQLVLPLFVVLILSLSFHEAAHAWTADKLGDPTARQLGRLSLNPLVHIDWIGTVLVPLVALYSGWPLIGWAKPVPVNQNFLQSPRRDFAIVALAGPVSNILLAMAGAVLIKTLVPAGAADPSFAENMLTSVVWLNVLLAVFNMIPVPPFDGGNVLAGMLPEAGSRLIDRLRPFGIAIVYVLMFSGFFSYVLFPIQHQVLRWLL